MFTTPATRVADFGKQHLIALDELTLLFDLFGRTGGSRGSVGRARFFEATISSCARHDEALTQPHAQGISGSCIRDNVRAQPVSQDLLHVLAGPPRRQCAPNCPDLAVAGR